MKLKRVQFEAVGLMHTRDKMDLFSIDFRRRNSTYSLVTRELFKHQTLEEIYIIPRSIRRYLGAGNKSFFWNFMESPWA